MHDPLLHMHRQTCAVRSPEYVTRRGTNLSEDNLKETFTVEGPLYNTNSRDGRFKFPKSFCRPFRYATAKRFEVRSISAETIWEILVNAVFHPAETIRYPDNTQVRHLR